MIQFILNNKLIQTDISGTSILSDLIRYKENLKGTKIGCREGDCGACTVLVGTLNEEKVIYRSIVSCLTPIANINGKHVVTIEGINVDDLTGIQSALYENSGTQCGFCTPGFVVSLTGFILSDKEKTIENAKNSIAGNICRCTGYKSIEKALKDIIDHLVPNKNSISLKWLIENKYLPEYFIDIPSELQKISDLKITEGNDIIGGGTDLYVQNADETQNSDGVFFINKNELKGISENNGYIELGASVTVSEIMESDIIKKYFPDIEKTFKLISSEQIRNMGTVGGNIVNASPIGDLSIFFLALDAELCISTFQNQKRKVSLKNFFRGYKELDLSKLEYIETVNFKAPEINRKFNFEKVSKRTYLDIASVNTAISYIEDENLIKDVHLSGGGLAPIPLYLKKTSEFLSGKLKTDILLKDAVKILQNEISPISDIRGSKEYKSLLAEKLFYCHFNL